MTYIEWKGKRVMEASPASGHRFLMDAQPEPGGQSLGPTPLEAFLLSGAACSAMDVVQILEKKRQKVTSYRVEVEGERPSDGPYPRPFKRLVFRHIIEGENLDEAAVRQAVELSDEKYCTVIATIRSSPEVVSEYRIRQTA